MMYVSSFSVDQIREPGTIDSEAGARPASSPDDHHGAPNGDAGSPDQARTLSPAKRAAINRVFLDAVRHEPQAQTAHGHLNVALLEHEVYAILDLLELPTPRRFMLTGQDFRAGTIDPAAVARQLEVEIGSASTHVYLKAQASGLLHKTEAGAIRRVAAEPEAILTAARELVRSLEARGIETLGVLVVESVSIGESAGLPVELLLGGRLTRDFGPIVMLSAGGVGAEFWNARLQPSAGPVLLSATGGIDRYAALLAAERMTVADLAYGRFRGQAPLTTANRVASWIQMWGALLDAFAPEHGPAGGGNGDGASIIIEEAEINPLVIRRSVDGDAGAGDLVPLDGLIRIRVPAAILREETSAPDNESSGRSTAGPMRHSAVSGEGGLSESERVDALAAMLRPKTVAVSGVSGSRVNSGRVILRNLLAGNFRPDQLAIIKPNAQPGDEIDGVACYASMSAVPFDRVDLFVVAVDAATTVAMLEETGGRVGGALLIAGGTSEREEGVDLGRRLGRVLDEARIVAVGPNSLGIVASPAGLDTLFIPETKLPRSTRPPAPLAYISQSGAFMITRMNRLPKFEPLYAISTGNQLRSGISEVVEAVARDPAVRVFAVYVEGFNAGDGVRLCRVARQLRREGRTVILYKAGRTAQGAAAASGHTASIAGDAEVCRQLVEQAGVLFADDFDEFEDLVRLATSWAKAGVYAPSAACPDAPLRIALLSNAGYECVGMADHLGPPLELVQLGPAAIDRFRSVLALRHIDAIVDVHNPMDITPMADTDVWVGVVETMLSLGRVPVPTSGDREESTARLVAAQQSGDQDPVDVLLISIVPPTPTLQTLSRGPGHREDALGEGQVAAQLLRTVAEHQDSVRSVGDGGGIAPPVRVAFCVDCGPLYDVFAEALGASGLPVFRSSDRAVSAIRRLLRVHYGGHAT